MAKGKSGAYWFKSSWLVAVILSVIPVINWWLGVAHRFVKKNYLGVIVYIIFGAVLGFVDFVTILLKNEIVVLA